MPAPPTASRFAPSTPAKFTKAEIEQKLIDRHNEISGSFGRDESLDYDRDIAGRSFTFYAKLPGEIRDIIASHPETRRLFTVTDDPARAGGEDYAQSLGWDKFETEAVELAGGRLRTAKEFFGGKVDFDPEAAFLVALHDALPKGGLRNTVDAVDPSALPVGTSFEIAGEKFTVEQVGEGEFTYTVLRDGDRFPETPAGAVPAIPVDKGSLELPDGSTDNAFELNPPGDAGTPVLPPAYPERTRSEITAAMGAAARPEFGRSLADEFDAGLSFLERVLAEDPIENRVVVALNRPGDANASLLQRIAMKYNAAGAKLHVVEHPDQRWYDTVALAREIADDPRLAAEATPADLGVSGATTAPLRGFARLLGTATPGGRLANLGDEAAGAIHAVYRTLSGSAATVTRGSARDPLGFHAGAAAENLKSVYDAARDRTIIAVRDAYTKGKRGGPITFEGRRVNSRAEFYEAVAKTIRTRAAGDEGFQPTALTDVHSSIDRAADTILDHFRRIGREAADVGLLEKFDPERAFLPRIYDVAKVRAGEADFKARLVDSFERASLRGSDGLPISMAERPLISEVAEKLDADRLAELVKTKTEATRKQSNLIEEVEAVEEPPATLVEGDLPDDLWEAYDAQREAFWRSNAETAARRIMLPEHSHGVEDAVKPFASRSLTIDEADLAEYMVANLEEILGRYGYAVHGRIGVRRAIQLNPELWRGKKLKDGTPVESGEHLIRLAHEQLDTLDGVARQANRDAGLTDAAAGSLTEKIRALRKRVDHDLGVPLAILEGRHPFGSDFGVFGALRYMGRTALRTSHLNKLGSVAVAQLTDLAPLVLRFMAHPHELRLIPRAIREAKSLPLDDLRAMGLGLEGIIRERAINGVDDLVAGRGFGEGRTRRVSARAELGLERVGDAFSRLTLMPQITDAQHRLAGTMVLADLTRGARAMVKADRLTKAGRGLDAALREAGLTRAEAARLNKLGLNAATSRKYLDLVYEHGLTEKDDAIRDLIPQAAFLEGGDVPGGGIVKPNFGEWDPEDAAAVMLRDTLAANVQGEVSKSVIVGPGVFDRPLINTTVLGRLFNQFQSFALAFGNQRLRVLGQLPASYQLAHLAAYFALGALSDAVSNALSGRRSLEETARMWEENPTGAAYGAVDRSGMIGWLGRPLAIADALKLPMSPSQVFGAQPATTAARHISPGRVLTMAGPAAADVDRAFRVASLLGQGEGRQATYEAWRLAPAQNLVWLRMLHRGFGLPVVPEAIRPPPANPRR